MKFQCKNCSGIIISEQESGFTSCGLCGADWPIPDPLSEGVVIDDFLILKKIGEGGMGDVFLTYDFPLDRNVAIKVLKSDISKDTELRNSFIKEARSVASLNHPNIVQAYKVDFDEDDNLFFAMEYVEGKTLRNVIDTNDKPDELQILEIAIDIVDALGHAWGKRQLVHRDIKPENIMISDEDDKTKLMDLGLSCHVEEAPEEEGLISGTPQYISPEQIMGNSLDIRTDFYCLGATLYHILAGRIPFDGDSFEDMVMKHLQELPKPLKEHRPDLSDATVEIIECLMEKDPANRFQTAKALLSALNSAKSVVEERGQTSKGKKIKATGKKPSVLPMKSLINAFVVLPLICFIVYIVLTSKNDQKTQTRSGPWSPAYIDTELWLDASDTKTIIHKDGFVEAWKDKSQNSLNLIQSSSKKRPSTNLDSINGLNALTFVSLSNTNLQLQKGLDWEYAYVVMKCLIVNNKKSSLLGSVLEMNDKDGDGKPDKFAADREIFINGLRSSDAEKLLTPSLLLLKSPFANTSINIGGNKFNSKIAFDGNIAEIILIRGNVSIEDRIRIEGYLAHKWGLQKLLPETHLYRSAAPK